MAVLFIFPPTPLDKTGLATESQQQAQTALLTDIDNKVSTAVKQDTINTSVNNLITTVQNDPDLEISEYQYKAIQSNGTTTTVYPVNNNTATGSNASSIVLHTFASLIAAFRFSLTAPTVLSSVAFELIKGGSYTGNLFFDVYSDTGAAPGTLIQSSNPVNEATLPPTNAAVITFTYPVAAALPAGNYVLVPRSSVGAVITGILAGVGPTAVPSYFSSDNGTTWAPGAANTGYVVIQGTQTTAGTYGVNDKISNLKIINGKTSLVTSTLWVNRTLNTFLPSVTFSDLAIVNLATEALQISQSTTLTNIKSDTASILSSTASIDTKTSSVVTSVASIDSKLTAPLQVRTINSLIPVVYDYFSINSKNAAGDPLVIVYKTGGSAGTTVATLTLTYDVDGDLTTTTRT